MAMPETVAQGVCDRIGCKRPVDVKINKGGFAYYQCGCGWSGRAHTPSSSRKYLQEPDVKIEAAEPDLPAKIPQKAAPVAPVLPAKEPQKAAPEKPKPAPGSLAELMDARS